MLLRQTIEYLSDLERLLSRLWPDKIAPAHALAKSIRELAIEEPTIFAKYFLNVSTSDATWQNLASSYEGKIPAIKKYREIYGSSLGYAKQVVETYMTEKGVKIRSY